MSESQWTRVAEAAEIGADKPRTIKTHGKQIVLFRLESDELQAIDNRCPHEGYPLSTGMLKDGVLTCEWHNWKFRLCDGACLLGGEDVRHYPLQIKDGGVWLDIGDPPVTQAVPGLYASLDRSFDENDWGHAGRTIERLLQAGEPGAAILGHGCDWGASHAPYGFDHGLAAAADLAALLPDMDAEQGIVLLEALNLMVEPNLRRPEREWPAAEAVTAPDPDAGWNQVETELRRRIEAEDLAGAEALLRGAIAAGAGPDQVFAWLTHAATDHFLGYGHSHIYCVKAEELLQEIGWDHAHPVLTSLVSNIVYETREDRLPYMREFRAIMAAHTGRLDAWARATPDAAARLHADEFLAAVVDGSLGDACAAVAGALDRGVAPHRIALLLAKAAAHRLMRFDARHEHDDEVSEGWLSITHALTHADAVHQSLVRRPPSADTLRGLFHSARFVQHLAVCDAPEAERQQPAERVLDADAEDLGLGRALVEHNAPAAMAAARAGWQRNAPVRQALVRATLADRASLPIFVVHHIKTTMAALRVTEAISRDPALGASETADLPLVATARFVASPLQERRVARRAKISRTFVRDGRMQTKLLGY